MALAVPRQGVQCVMHHGQLSHALESLNQARAGNTQEHQLDR